jgi:hypothetical protein
MSGVVMESQEIAEPIAPSSNNRNNNELLQSTELGDTPIVHLWGKSMRQCPSNDNTSLVLQISLERDYMLFRFQI